MKGIKVIFTVRVTAIINLFMDRVLSARAISEVKYLSVITLLTSHSKAFHINNAQTTGSVVLVIIKLLAARSGQAR